MKTFFLSAAVSLFALISAVSPERIATAQVNSAKELVGLWEAKRRFGPDVRGTLLVKQSNGEWQAEISGRKALVKLTGEKIAFELPNGEGAFQGNFDSRRTKIVGHWIQPATVMFGVPFASPVILTKDRQNIWRGDVSPLDDALTFYLVIKARNDGSVGAFLKNPERNVGRFIRVDHIEREGETVKLFAANSGGETGRVLVEGRYNGERETLSIYFPTWGGTFDFKRVGYAQASDFYPRGRPTVPYVYAPPPVFDDGWQTASLEDVGISREGIQKFIQMIIDTPIDSVSSQEIHGVLIARHGKLVLEEYFHGKHREKPHDTRSASKSLTATLFGAAIKVGVPVDVSSPVYRVMNGGTFPSDLDPRKKALTVEHLLTMSPGLDCDDGDPKSIGNENTMQEQTEQPDWYKYTLDLKMVRQPGEQSLYCTAGSNLVGGVLKRASGQSLPVLFHQLLAEPLQIKRYYMNLTPTGDAYMGGGVRFLPRDFMKLGQLHLNGGTWNGRKILSPEWAKRSTSHLVNVDKQLTYDRQTNQFVAGGSRMYGYQWWVEDYPYKGRTLRAFFAGGNGGQIVMGIPELDLVIAFYGGNYSDRVLLIPQWVYVPQYILPAVDN
ncbi:MAG: beta-lactamase family protein [Acidobacteriota bacterium]|nr:beta-lactamase family protein [Acidobacteriota bacterium]